MYYMSDSAQQIYTSQDLWSLLSNTVKTYNELILKEDNFKLDLDSPNGQQAFRSYVDNIQALINFEAIQTQCRHFRQQYTKAYRVLYSDSELGYIPEIFDAAQEGFTCIWVNAECYIFQPQTLLKGEKLVQTYFRLIQLIRLIFLHTQNKSKQIPLHYRIQLKEKLIDFDANWIAYERAYIQQLIMIEDQAKKTILDTVYVEEALTQYQTSQKIKGKIFYHTEPEFHEARRKLCQKIAKLNSIANINGKGRDDLSYDILVAAENVLKKISDSQSKSLRTAAQKIRESFNKLRDVLKGFAENIQLVDPQLRNNSDLVQALTQYEVNWQKGKRYFVEKRKECQILAFSTILEAAKQKYPTFKYLLEFSDPSVFWMIASVVVLNSLEGEDQGLAESFLQEIKPNEKLQQQFLNLKQQYGKWKFKHVSHKSNQLYNQLQKKLLGEEQTNQYSGEMANKIKQFAVSLERLNPTDWNDMLSVILTEDE